MASFLNFEMYISELIVDINNAGAWLFGFSMFEAQSLPFRQNVSTCHFKRKIKLRYGKKVRFVIEMGSRTGRDGDFVASTLQSIMAIH